ncbi:MAG: hypothetical protein KC609_01350 [Myxococcales bacterium]|nr:hypothetical protein [Myxococcales bacterium]
MKGQRTVTRSSKRARRDRPKMQSSHRGRSGMTCSHRNLQSLLDAVSRRTPGSHDES